eukprot:CAMPEP_0204895740 /NCGR_PEP_ID=MMETSP1349-20130617/34207_1 /ASSEMBLY_ACC=CAM_ASM_000710 /TAXON_ID=215587 /ORGANISM="Aplanochytrium stocchinoi, Strain GSBS06" /LENGTH=297 /DNA_ID=CAMNT_0052063175 /DNA_START=144 /DNA_END=1034 /DNA_ORIENTATION=-
MTLKQNSQPFTAENVSTASNQTQSSSLKHKIFPAGQTTSALTPLKDLPTIPVEENTETGQNDTEYKNSAFRMDTEISFTSKSGIHQLASKKQESNDKGSDILLLENNSTKISIVPTDKMNDTTAPNILSTWKGTATPELSNETSYGFQDIYRNLLQDESIFLWLSGDSNVETTSSGQVKKWTDRSNTYPKHVFEPTPANSHFTEIFGHEVSWFKCKTYTSLSLTEKFQDHHSLKGEPILEALDGSRTLATIKFPCSLESRGSQLPDDTPLTLFFAVQPEELKLGVTVAGQRFFGHYP